MLLRFTQVWTSLQWISHRTKVCRSQCDQIGLLLQCLGDIFSYKISPRFYPILKTSLLKSKTALAPFWATLVKAWRLLILASGHTDSINKCSFGLSTFGFLARIFFIFLRRGAFNARSSQIFQSHRSSSSSQAAAVDCLPVCAKNKIRHHLLKQYLHSVSILATLLAWSYYALPWTHLVERDGGS